MHRLYMSIPSQEIITFAEHDFERLCAYLKKDKKKWAKGAMEILVFIWENKSIEKSAFDEKFNSLIKNKEILKGSMYQSTRNVELAKNKLLNVIKLLRIEGSPTPKNSVWHEISTIFEQNFTSSGDYDTFDKLIGLYTSLPFIVKTLKYLKQEPFLSKITGDSYFEKITHAELTLNGRFFQELDSLCRKKVFNNDDILQLQAHQKQLQDAESSFTQFELEWAFIFIKYCLANLQMNSASEGGFKQFWDWCRLGEKKNWIFQNGFLDINTYFNVARSGYECGESSAVKDFLNTNLDRVRTSESEGKNAVRSIKDGFFHLLENKEAQINYRFVEIGFGVYFRSVVIRNYYGDDLYPSKDTLGFLKLGINTFSKFVKYRENRSINNTEKIHINNFKNFLDIIKLFMDYDADLGNKELIETIMQNFNRKKGCLSQQVWLAKKIDLIK
jgi:hypothetical protein